MTIMVGKTYKNHGGFRNKQLFVTGGVVQIAFGGSKKRLSKGDEIIIPKTQEYSIKVISKIKPAQLVKIEF
jgi:mannose-6-phosphate isomerase-like protein (cupin superfamily)